MPGILPMKVIKLGSNAPARIAQACDRCRSKKIRCDGFRPCCSQCANVGFECKTSDKLSRRAFPRGYTESLEERVRALEAEIRDFKDLLDSKDEKIDVLSRIHNGSVSRRASSQSNTDRGEARAAIREDPITPTFTVNQPLALQTAPGHDPHFMGRSSSRTMADTLKHKALESGRPFPSFDSENISGPSHSSAPIANLGHEAGKPPPRLVTDQMVNVFFQEWAPLFPVLHRPTFLAQYISHVADSDELQSETAQIQLNLVFGIAALSNRKRIVFNTTITEQHWLARLDTLAKNNTLAILQCIILAQMFCMQNGDYARVNRYRSQAIGMAMRLGLHQSQKQFPLNTLTCETRKKIFWTLYSLDCFSAVVLGLPPSLADNDIHCEYPVDVDDEYISEQGIQPVLPGESTKLSSALELFKAARILSRALRQLYPSAMTHQLAFSDIQNLSEELDEWLANLPAHLRIDFSNDKPATSIVNSRSPLLSLTYDYIRSLIYRPAVSAPQSDQASSSMLVLASSSKHMIQILQLLEERNLSFSMCLNKNELMTLCGCSLLIQALDLSEDSALMKDYQGVVCSVMGMLQSARAPSETDFRRIASSVLPLCKSSLASPGSATLSVSPEHSPIELMTSPSDSGDQRESAIFGEGTARKQSTPFIVIGGRSQSTARFRAIAPSTQRRFSRDGSVKSSPKTPSLCDASSIKSSRSPALSSTANLNLDYFTFPSDQVVKSKPRLPLPVSSVEENSPGWDHLFGSIAPDVTTQPSGSSKGEDEWPSFNDLLSPLQDAHTPAAPALSSADQWTADATLNIPDAAKSQSDTKPRSLLSFSGESVTSADDLNQYDWVSEQIVEMPGAFIDDATPVLDKSTASV